jgi:hypothetical protein
MAMAGKMTCGGVLWEACGADGPVETMVDPFLTIFDRDFRYGLLILKSLYRKIYPDGV